MTSCYSRNDPSLGEIDDGLYGSSSMYNIEVSSSAFLVFLEKDNERISDHHYIFYLKQRGYKHNEGQWIVSYSQVPR